jgi:hypothetical protein
MDWEALQLAPPSGRQESWSAINAGLTDTGVRVAQRDLDQLGRSRRREHNKELTRFTKFSSPPPH